MAPYADTTRVSLDCLRHSFFGLYFLTLAHAAVESGVFLWQIDTLLDGKVQHFWGNTLWVVAWLRTLTVFTGGTVGLWLYVLCHSLTRFELMEAAVRRRLCLDLVWYAVLRTGVTVPTALVATLWARRATPHLRRADGHGVVLGDLGGADGDAARGGPLRVWWGIVWGSLPPRTRRRHGRSVVVAPPAVARPTADRVHPRGGNRGRRLRDAASFASPGCARAAVGDVLMRGAWGILNSQKPSQSVGALGIERETIESTQKSHNIHRTQHE